MFNMGRQVDPSNQFLPVLPAPFSDEGVNLDLSLRMFCDCSATLDVYAVNGLQPGGPGTFNDSRRYYDNNRQPFVGGRVTFGNSFARLGGSMMAGEMQDDGSPLVYTRLGGVDLTAKYDDLVRFYFEYAIRSEDSQFAPGDRDHIYGIVAEVEVKIFEEIGLLGRYDTLEHRDTFTGDRSIDRFTWGVNAQLPGGSWLLLNHEHWMFNPSDYDVIAARWVATF